MRKDMARAVARVYDLCDCPCGCLGVILTGATTVFVENLPVALANYSMVGYPCACQVGVIIAGSPTVEAETFPVARIQDPVQTKCGIGHIVTASPTVFADD
jgi:uncharacterized Zn-binding protein involved in type VI secretion